MTTSEEVPEFNTDHLNVDLEFPEASTLLFPDVFVGLEVGLLAPGDGIVTDRHHASSDRYEADDPQNQIGGQISPFALSGWLRHGCERVLQERGLTACHPGEPNAAFQLADVYDRDLEAGYHEKGTCTDTEETPDSGAGCVVYDVFGGFNNRAGRLIRRPVAFSPVRRQVDVTKGQAEAHYRQLNTQVRSRNAADKGQPLRQATRDVVGNLVGTWRLTLRECRPEFVGLLLEAIAYLDAHSDAYELQLGGARNFGAGMADVEVINPLYTERELRRVYDRAKQPTTQMEEKDETWAEEWRPAFVEALEAHIAMARERGVPTTSTDDSEGPA